MQALAVDFSALIPTPVRVEPVIPVMKGLRKKLWLRLYTEGGTWTAREISRLFPHKSAREMHSELADMVQEAFLVRKVVTSVDGDSVVKFGVASNCRIPRGVTIEEIEELLRMAVTHAKPWTPTI